MSQMQAEQPATTYADFKREILNEVAPLEYAGQHRGREFVGIQLCPRPPGSPDLLQVDPRRTIATRVDGLS